VASYYGDCVREHGETARGVDWSSAGSQELRFQQLLRILPASDVACSILDYGCGYGALVDSLASRGRPFRYLGFDISAEMIERARRRHRRPDCTFSTDLRSLGTVDHAVASGVLNVKLDVPLEAWREHVSGILADLDRVSTKGFAFNALTSYSDPQRMIEQLFYADPCEYFDLCKLSFSPQVALLHDYGLFEFTILVRKGG
jgi:SAM-dependent methyltransferase